MARAIDALRPGLVVIENVRGIYSAAANSDVEPCPWCVGDDPAEPSLRALGAVLGDLADIGYDAVWTGLRAADIGAPHERFRVFVVAWPSDYIPDAQFLGRGGRPGIGVLGGPVKLLPTPAVNDMGAGKTVDEWDGWTASMKAKHGNGNGHGPSLSVESLRLLPTPDTTHGRETTRTGPLLGGLPSLLPSPRASDGEKVGPSQLGSSGDLALPSAVQNGRWGAYAAAVARWEALTRPAQQPTEPTGRDGAHRLSAYFTEWMMGLPEGWVCDTPGVTRAEALRMCGNGVVPQQAAAAIAHLLDVRSSLPAPSNESVP
jgi:DNA (cytosine-5)-methyltransferase 1